MNAVTTFPSLRAGTSSRLAQKRRRPQQGMVLVFALLALVALSFAAAGLVRSSGGAAMVIGNLGFKAEANAFADRGAEAAINWLQARTEAVLVADNAAQGYYATHFEGLDPTGQRTDVMANRVGVDWDGDGCANLTGALVNCISPSPQVKIGDTSYQFVVTRLCSVPQAVDAVGNVCSTGLQSIELDGEAKDEFNYARALNAPAVAVLQPSYRIVVRSVGARNAVSYTESIVRR